VIEEGRPARSRRSRVRSRSVDSVERALRRLSPELTLGFDMMVHHREVTTQVAQRALVAQWRANVHQGMPIPTFEEAGFSVYSQSNEDGILLLLFTFVGTTNKTAIELSVGNPSGANTTNLIVNWSWTAGLIEGSPYQAELARRWFARNPRTADPCPPTVIEAWVTAENVNELFHASGLIGEIDLLSLDVDGIDLWLWHALEVVQPRVVVAEFSHLWGPNAAVTVPNDAGFTSDRTVDRSYCGASLEAFVRVAAKKGYRLVGVNARVFNAFFMRNDVGDGLFASITPQAAFAFPSTFQSEPSWSAEGLPGRWLQVPANGDLTAIGTG
jgi:hypothetical protein